MVEICLLGCGGMMPLPDRWLTSMLYRHNGKMILIDCGEGAQIPIKLSGWGFKAIEAICFTHYHADHVAGLPGFLLSLGNSGREEPLRIYGPLGLAEVVKGLTVIAPELPFDIILVELSGSKPEVNKLGDIIINSTPAEHSLPCLAYNLELKRAGRFDVTKAKALNIPMELWGRLQSGEEIAYEGKLYKPDLVLGKPRKGLKVTYFTDTRPTDDLVNFSKDSDLLICEGIYGDEDKLPKAIEKKHMIFSEAATIAKNSNSKELWLTHYSPALTEPELFLDNAKNIFTNSHLGKDLKTKTLSFEES